MAKQIKELLSLIEKDSKLTASLDKSQRLGGPVNITGLCEQQKGYVIAAASYRCDKKPIVIVSDYTRARNLIGSLAPFTGPNIPILKPAELSLVSAVASSHEHESERTGVAAKLIKGDFDAAIICAPALLNKMPSPEGFKRKFIKLDLGKSYDPVKLTSDLQQRGYERVGMVSQQGEFSARGDVIDVFPPDMEKPIRISFFDDEIDQLKTFNPDDQRSIEGMKHAVMCPAYLYTFSETERGQTADEMIHAAAPDINKMNATSRRTVGELLERYSEADSNAVRQGMRISSLGRWIGVINKTPSSILDYLNRSRMMLFVDEFSEGRSRMDGYTADFAARIKSAYELGQAPSCSFESIFKAPDAMKALDSFGGAVTLACLKSSMSGLPGGDTIDCPGLSGENWVGRDEALINYIRNGGGRSSSRIVFMLTGASRVDSFRNRMLSGGIDIEVIASPLPAGFEYPAAGLTLIGEQEIFGSEKKQVRNTKSGGARITFFGDVAPGDYVVHDVHGIGLYEGIVNLKMGKSSQDYLKINYAKNAVIYLPVDKIDKLSKYVGPGGKTPKLSSLDSQEWKKNVERARTSVKKLAFDLVKLYAVRRANKGFTCAPDDTYQKEFEENFPYEETADQIDAIRDIKKDMESPIPMDRLLCGDVGFGKTEVAFRAIFKCVMNGRQAFMIAPTTLLAQQHYDNLKERLGGFPIKVVLLSRFVPTAVMKQNLQDIKEGKADVVIGTHRILSDDVVPSKLGLLVVDEEQRFGVNHKEKIKAMRSNIDVLTLTATPIPRTLHMSMSGIRDISMLSEAPLNRRPVQTYVMEYDEEICVQACLREISRGGQIFWLYNRTADIDTKAAHLKELMPDVRVVYAHGKMSENQMEKIVESFIKGEADILVCTTIIESGVDMPNVNTMIVEDAERFGLSQLYQIKGRVGRSDRQAYAYITYRPDREMNSDARKRLMAIREFTELGSGVKIALRDLEVRGAGNLLGAEQHGHMDVVGYELYCRMLDEEIKHLNETGDTEFRLPLEVNVEIDFDSYIPPSYIEDEASRMAAYRRIGAISTQKDMNDLIDELTDRYGQPPREVEFLCRVALIKALAGKAGFEKVCLRDTGVLLYFASDRKADFETVSLLLGIPEYQGRILFCAQGKPYLHYKPKDKNKARTASDAIDILNILIDKKQ
ncbi:MAG: transcription-repair coupling factor [Clostridiales bacterium]|nr:transcription-repair coupling factor [Clostridiales bacterium]